MQRPKTPPAAPGALETGPEQGTELQAKAKRTRSASASGADATSRARTAKRAKTARRAEPAEVERRLAVVAKHFGEGDWSSKVVRRFAKEWGVAERTVRDYSRQVSRLARMTQTADDIAFERELAANRLDRIHELATVDERGQPRRHPLALRVAMDATEARLRALGAHPDQKLAPVETALTRPVINLHYAPMSDEGAENHETDPVQPAGEPGPPSAANGG